MILDNLLGANPYAWAIKLGVEALGIAALAGGLWWGVSWVEGVYHDHLALPGVQKERDAAVQAKAAIEQDEIKRLDGIVARLDAIQKAQQALGVTVAANQAAIDASIADFEGKVRHATNLTPGSADDRLVRDSLCQLLKCP